MRNRALRCRRRYRPAVSDTDHLRDARTPAEDWPLFSEWAEDIFKVFDWNVVNDEPDHHARLEGTRSLSSTNGAPAGATCSPTT